MLFNKLTIVTTRNELLNHSGWREIVSSRTNFEGFGKLVFRTFELDCGQKFHIRIFITESIDLSLMGQQLSRPYVATCFQTIYGRFGTGFTRITDCTNRTDFYALLYKTLDERFPL